ncbi:hypothetical protein KCU76_g114, partial [Aureobasidium melanogenum]
MLSGRRGFSSGSLSCPILVSLVLLKPLFDINVGGGYVFKDLLEELQVLVILDDVLQAVQIHDHIGVVVDSAKRATGARAGALAEKLAVSVALRAAERVVGAILAAYIQYKSSQGAPKG